MPVLAAPLAVFGRQLHSLKREPGELQSPTPKTLPTLLLMVEILHDLKDPKLL